MLSKRICVYKITSPSKKVYIGSTIDFQKRVRRYKTLECKQQIRLYNSLKKYGFDKHKIEILCHCDIEDVRQKEAYYGQLYNCLGEYGLNCHLPAHAEGFASKSDEARQAIRNRMVGKKASEETKRKMSEASRGHKLSEEAKKRIGDKNRGHKRHTDEQRKMIVERLTGAKWTKEALLKRTLTNSTILLNPETGIYYYGARDAAKSVGLPYTTMYRRLYKSKVQTPFIIT